MHQAAVGVHSDVRFHPEEPPVALPGLMHLGVALTFDVPGGAGRRDSRVNHAAALEQRAPCGLRLDNFQEVVCQVVGLQQSPEVQDGRLVGIGSFKLSCAKLRSKAIS